MYLWSIKGTTKLQSECALEGGKLTMPFTRQMCVCSSEGDQWDLEVFFGVVELGDEGKGYPGLGGCWSSGKGFVSSHPVTFLGGVTSQEQQHHQQVQLLSETPVLGRHWDFIVWDFTA